MKNRVIAMTLSGILLLAGPFCVYAEEPETEPVTETEAAPELTDPETVRTALAGFETLAVETDGDGWTVRVLTPEAEDPATENAPEESTDSTETAPDAASDSAAPEQETEEAPAAPEIVLTGFETVTPYYALTPVYARALPDFDAEIVKILGLAEQAEALAEGSGWVLIRTDDGVGFVSAKYMSASKEDAEQSVKQENAEIARQQAAAAAAAAAAARSSSGRKSSGKKSSGKSVVGTENIANCDDPNHGTTVITYSDGSVSYKNY